MRYDDELQSYLKSQGLRSLKSKTKKKPEPKPLQSSGGGGVQSAVHAASAASVAPRREPSIAQPPPAHSTPAASQQQQLAQAFMGLPIAGGLPMAVGMSPGMMGMLPHFSQVGYASYVLYTHGTRFHPTQRTRESTQTTHDGRNARMEAVSVLALRWIEASLYHCHARREKDSLVLGLLLQMCAVLCS